MKIAVDLLSIRPDGSAGGATGFALELVKGMASRQGIQVMVLCADWNIKYLRTYLPKSIQMCQVAGEYNGVGIRIIDKLTSKIRQKMQSKSILKANGVDILYCPFSAATYKEKGIPTVSTILDIQHEYYPQFFEPQELVHRRRFYQDIVKKVENVVCISEYTKDTFCEKYGFPVERAKTIYIAIQNRFLEEDDTVLDKLNIRDQKYIVYPANFWEHKNHKLLLNAFAMYVWKNKDLKLVLTGNVLENAGYYADVIQTMKIEEYVVITGYVTNEELFSILKNSKGLIYPSLFEGFGIPVVEAMFLHKLIACSNLTSLPEIGCDAIHYFNPKKPDEILDAISFLAKSDITDKMIKEYDIKLLDYKSDKMVEAYLKVFDDVVNKKEDFIFQEEVTGVYPDGWSGSEICIQLRNRINGRLRIKITLPEFIHLKEKIILRNNEEARWLALTPGDSLELEEEIMDDYSTITLRMSKLWSPKDVLKSEDGRKLGIMVESLIFESDGGEIVNLKDWI